MTNFFNKMISRRNFVITGSLGIAMAIVFKLKEAIKFFLASFDQHPRKNYSFTEVNPSIFISKNGTPQQNIEKVLELVGGVEKYIGLHDIVIIKPNAQWWNQGRTNLAAMKGFIDIVLGITGFKGEIIIAENNHFVDKNIKNGEEDNTRGWTHLSEINGDIDGKNHTINTLINLYTESGIKNVTKYHWRDGGPKLDIWGNGQNGGIVSSPAEGDGYIWTHEDYFFTGFAGLKTWKVKMTYPIFTSKYSNITVDLKNGAYLRDGNGSGTYLSDRPIKLINFAVLNNHGGDTGITSALKNYMGITDLSCGYWGIEPKEYSSVHFVGEDYYPYAKAGAIAHFMKTIRKADLNIVTAEWIGWGHRTDTKRATHAKTILASEDPIALDYYSAKNLVFPLSKDRHFHDPDFDESAIHKFLHLALETYGSGTLDDSKFQIQINDFTA